MTEGDRIIKVNIGEEMKSAYIDYSMSVIVSRALPDVRDGLKPVHRRVLFGMSELGTYSNKPFKKSARIVGEVLGKYHPHGDSSVYEAMVRMAQPWSLRYMLVNGQGNFGSVDGDNPAAMRYTEAKLRKFSEETLRDLEKDTVDFKLNFDDTLKEPTVLPTRIPTLLVNGASGIAVGMATNMPPHNLTDSIDAILAYIKNNEIEIEELADILKAPDFPTGGIIYGYQGCKDAFLTGRGRIVLRAKTEIETSSSGRERLIVNEIPYMVNKAEMIKKTADLINDKKIDGISNLNDESDRNGMRIVYDLKRDAIANVVLNKLFKYTQLQSIFSVNNIALVKGRPKLLNLKQIVSKFADHRHEVVTRRTKFELDQAEKKAHILEGLLIALDHIDEVIKLIRASKTPDEAKNGLMSNFKLSEVQAKAILDMRLQKLTGLESEKLKEDYDELQKLIAHLKEILDDTSLRVKIITDELIEIKEKYGDERKTDIVPDEGEFNPEDFYADENVVITISHLGYLKRTKLDEFKSQHRGGKGSKGSTTRDKDFIEHMFVASMHNTMLFFTEQGKCFWLKVYDIPEGSRTSKGRAIQNVLNIAPDDQVKAYINVKNLNDEDYINNNYILMATKKGVVKKTALEQYSRPRQNGVNAITIREDDSLIEAKLTNGESDIILASREGKAIRFNEKDVRSIGRTGTGVRGIRLSYKNDEVIGMVWVEDIDNEILVVSENGFGKRSNTDNYRTIKRGGKGVKTFNISEKTGKLIAIRGVSDSSQIMIINHSGITIRLKVSDIRVTGRATQGVKLINLAKNDIIAAVTHVSDEDEDEIINEENNELIDNNNNNETEEK
ncbi:MAG: DNA gyrase subunit A [Bacteroidales bacterium]|jgi:DNA gyrase subunit A|nr:DNA gyrase subunit A [Bacteroidales bacterium]